MAEISAASSRSSASSTGAGMMDCKRALQETDGDLEAARILLRERGMAQARQARRPRDDRGARARPLGGGQSARSSPSAARPSRSRTTTSSARSPRRRSTASSHDGEGAAEKLEGERVELVAKLGENIVVRTERHASRPIDGEDLAQYVHPPANKIGVLVQLRGDDADARPPGGDAHRVAGAAVARRATTCPEDAVAAEREIYRELRRGAVEARAGPREDRRRDAQQALLRREGVLCSTRRGSTTRARRWARRWTRRARGARVRPRSR